MTLGDLLTLLRESILNDRTDRTSGSSDYLWTDQTLVTFINEAQRKFAVESLILRDGTTDAATLVTLVPGQDIYDLHPSVIGVMSAQAVGISVALQRLGHSIFTGFRNITDRPLDPASFANAQPAMPVAYSTDEAVYGDAGGFGGVTMRVSPTPGMAQAGAALRLRVVRKPLVQLTATDTTVSPELPDDHHIEMLDWAAYLALRIVDDDAGAPARAQEFAAAFAGHVQDARKLAMRKMFAPTGWGFGRGGFSWDS